MRLCFLSVLVALSPALLAQDTIRVPSQVPTIQAAIELAQDGDTVLVAPGRYVGTLDFLGKAIRVRSEAGPASTIIDGADGSFLPVVRFHNGEGTDSILRGFTITNGNNLASDSWGGGISCLLSGQNRGTPTIRRCIITGNRAWSSPGAGVTGNPVLEDCEIRDNSADYPGNDNDGGGVWGAPTMRRCVVSGNSGYDGGGIYLSWTGTSALIEDCVITQNYAAEGARGGGIYVGTSNTVIRRCLIVNNTGYGYGGMTTVAGAGIHVSGPAAPRLERCTIVANAVVQGSIYNENWGGVFGSATLVDCIVRDNDEVQVDATSSASFSNVQGGFPGTGNIDLDSLFVDAANGDFHLLAGSPCIDAGDPAGELDPDCTRADLGAFPFSRANTVLRNGSGLNRVAFTSLTPPVVGGTWNARIDSSGHPGVLLATLLVVERPLPAPLLLPAGELLVDPRGPILARRSQPAAGGFADFALAIPANPALIGFHASAQATLLGGGTELLNALDLKLGN